MITEPSLDIYYDQGRGLFLLDNHAIDKQFGFRTSWGSLVRVPVEEMSRRGIDIVLENLKEFTTRSKIEKSELEVMSPSEQREFEERHRLAGIQLSSSNMLLLLPMKRDPAGGYTGEQGDRLEIPLPCDNAKFYQVLLAALARSRTPA
jgi:hypothetical protein